MVGPIGGLDGIQVLTVVEEKRDGRIYIVWSVGREIESWVGWRGWKHVGE